MSVLLVDTHTVVWHLFVSRRLSTAADAALAAAVAAGDRIFVSAISIVEIVYLIEKNKLLPAVLNGLLTCLRDQANPLTLLPIDEAVAQATQQIPRAIVPDLPDRIISATALAHNLPLVTADRKIQAAPIRTIW